MSTLGLGVLVAVAVAWSLGLVVAMGLAHPADRRAAAVGYVVMSLGLPALTVLVGMST